MRSPTLVTGLMVAAVTILLLPAPTRAQLCETCQFEETSSRCLDNVTYGLVDCETVGNSCVVHNSERCPETLAAVGADGTALGVGEQALDPESARNGRITSQCTGLILARHYQASDAASLRERTRAVLI